MRQHGLEPGVARQVAAGKQDLNEVLKRMANADEVQRLMDRHGFNRALATQIVLGHADLDLTLARRRVEAHLQAHRERSVLEEARQRGAELTLGLHGRRTLRARVLAVEPYEVVVVGEDGVEERIHKVQLKYAFAPEAFKQVKKGLEYDNERRAHPAEPRFRPQDRYGCSDRRLGLALDRKTPVTAVTLEGECFSGEVVWVSRFEIGLRTKAGGEVVVFRHALDDFRDGSAPARARPR